MSLKDHPPQRTASKFISQEFQFLNHFDDEDNDSELQVDVDKKNDDEFTIVTYVDHNISGKVKNGYIDPVEKDFKSVGSDSGFLEPIIEINPVYEVNDESFERSEEIHKYQNSDDDDKTTEDSVINEHSFDEQGGEIDCDNKSITESDSAKVVEIADTNQNESNSVIIDGEKVDLRNTGAGIHRQSRTPTWKVNQTVVSEAFGFLKSEDGFCLSDELDDNLRISQECDRLEPASDDTGNELESKKSSISSSEQQRVDTENYGVCQESVDIENNGVCQETEVDSEIVESQEGPDKVSDLVKRRNKFKKKEKSETDDDGDSSDEDTGVYM